MDLLKDNTSLMREYCFEKNSSMDLSTLSLDSKQKVWWICSKGHSYQQTISNKAKGKECPICSNTQLLKGFNDLASVNPAVAKEWDYEKNTLSPKEVVAGSGKKVWWICPKCNNSYDATVANRNGGSGCPYCAGKRIIKGFNDAKTWCIENNRLDIIEEFDQNKNEFDLESITVGCGKQIWFVCPNGHSYKTTLHKRINYGAGCGICSHKVFSKGSNDLLTTHPEIANEWDYGKNTEKPDEVMAGNNTKKYWFICPKGHSYSATLLSRKKGNNCPRCSAEKRTSFPERAILYYLNIYLDDVRDSYHNTILGKKEIDVFLPRYRFGIEYDGVAWHGNLQRDFEKDKACLDQGITILRIRETGCPEYKSNSIKRYIAPHNMRELNDAILFIFDVLNKQFNLNIDPDVDIDRDRIKILELMNLTEKENSIAYYCPEIKQYWDYEKNGSITPEQISRASLKRIYLRCKNGHQWETCAHDFSASPGCHICSGKNTQEGINDLFATNPELKSQWSGKNTIDPTTIRNGSNKRALWVCPDCGYEYEMIVRDKAAGTKCPYCSNRKLKIGYNDFKTTHPDLAAEWDYEKNGAILPEQFFDHSTRKVWWRCTTCSSSFERTLQERSKRGFGCPYCSGHALKPGYNDFKTKYPLLAAEWHLSKNGDDKPENHFPSSTKPVWWKCSRCGYEWIQLITTRRRSGKCPSCHNRIAK